MTASRGPSRARRPPSRHPRPAVGPAVEFEARDGVGWITLARPMTRNRCDAELSAALVDACAAAEDADGVRVAVLAALGPTFSAGLMRPRPRPDPAWPDAIAAVGGMTKPVIAAVQGDAVGWGLALALACDLRVASTEAVFALPELAAGRFPVGGVTQRLPRMVGVARALDLVLLGTRLTARRAAEWGLLSAVVPPARLRATVGEMARALVTRGPVALRLAKEAVVRALDVPLADGIRLEEDLYVLLQTTEDRREGIRAFLERRKPVFHGR